MSLPDAIGPQMILRAKSSVFARGLAPLCCGRWHFHDRDERGRFLFLSIYVLYMTRDLGLGAEAVGLVFAAGGVGALLGSVSAGPARGRWGVGRVLLGSQILFGLFGMLVPLAVLFPDAALPLVVAAEFLQWVMVLVFSVNAVSLRQAITPDRLLGRVNGTMRFIVWGSQPIGSLLGGYLGSRNGLPATWSSAAFGMLIGLYRADLPHPAAAFGREVASNRDAHFAVFDATPLAGIASMMKSRYCAVTRGRRPTITR